MNKLFIRMKNSQKNNIMVQMMDDVGKTSLANRDLPATYLFWQKETRAILI